MNINFHKILFLESTTTTIGSTMSTMTISDSSTITISGTYIQVLSLTLIFWSLNSISKKHFFLFFILACEDPRDYPKCWRKCYHLKDKCSQKWGNFFDYVEQNCTSDEKTGEEGALRQKYLDTKAK